MSEVGATSGRGVSRRRAAVEALACAALFVALGSAWAVSYPAAEPPDEVFHLMYASHLAREGRRPVMRPPETVEVPVEGNQPPLYYHLAAWMLDAAGLEGFRVETPPLNPRSNKRGGTEPAVYAHEDPTYPWETVERATRLLRLGYLPVGAVAVLCAYFAGRTVRPEDPAVALLAGGFAASVPQFTFVMGSVSNDVLANGLAALSLVLLLDLVTTGRGIAGVAVLGAVVGLGMTRRR
jgi:hypothetical protein